MNMVGDIKMNKQKNRKIVTISIIILILLIGVIASSYAYFQAVVSNGSNTATSVNAKTIDDLLFTASDDISITANQDNFASGKGDITVYSYPLVRLIARNDEASSYDYTMCINITENTFVHSQVGSTNQGLGISPNLFNIDLFEHDDDYAIDLSPIYASGYTGYKFSEICPNCKEGQTYRFYAENWQHASISGLSGVLSTNCTFDPSFWPSSPGYYNECTITSDILNSYVFLRSSDGKIVKPQIFVSNSSNGDIYLWGMNGHTSKSYGISVPNYYPYGYVKGTEIELEVKNGQTLETLLTKDITGRTGTICVPTSNGGTETNHTITAEAGKSTIDIYQVVVTLKNYSTSQNINEGKKLTASVDFTRVD